MLVYAGLGLSLVVFLVCFHTGVRLFLAALRNEGWNGRAKVLAMLLASAAALIVVIVLARSRMASLVAGVALSIVFTVIMRKGRAKHRP